MREQDILIWAAGASGDLSGSEAVDEERLLSLLTEHRLFPRFLARLQGSRPTWRVQDRPPWCSRALAVQTWTQARAIQKDAARQIAAAREIAAHCPEHPPIWIKGFATYALTGNPAHLRYSADVDVLAPDPEAFKDALFALNFADSGIVCVDHEFAMLLRGGVGIEIHRFFPVWAYPEEITPADVARLAEPAGVVHTPAYFRLAGQIEYADLRENAVPGTTCDTETLLFPCPEMAALILCAHVFRNYVERGGFHLVYPISLSELANIAALASLPAFQPERFLHLTDQFGAQHSVELTGDLLHTYFGSSPLPQPSPESAFSRQAVFPQSLLWWPSLVGTSAVLSALDDQIDRNTNRVVEQLGANEVIAYSKEGVAPEYRVLDGAESIENVITRTVDDECLPFRFSVGWSEDGLAFDIRLPTGNPNEVSDALRFNFGTVYAEWQYKEGILTTELGANHTYRIGGEGSLEPQEQGYTFRLLLHWQDLPACAGERRTLPMVLTVEREVGSDAMATIVPLRIVHA